MEYHLAKGFVIPQQNSKNLSSVPNESKQKIHVINIHKLEFVMAFYTENFSIENTKIYCIFRLINILVPYITSIMIKKRSFMDFFKYIKPLLKDIDHHALIQEWKQNLDAAAYENIYKQRSKDTIQEEIN